MNATLRPLFVLFVLLSLVTGVAYPLVVTGVAKVAFPSQAAGSLVERDGKVVGSTLIGQNFSDPKYFWSRPSATSPMSNNAGSSGGSNLGPSNPALPRRRQGPRRRLARGRSWQPRGGAGRSRHGIGEAALDPEISLAAAEYQTARVARVRSLPIERVRSLVGAHASAQTFGFLGEAGQRAAAEPRARRAAEALILAIADRHRT